MPLSDRTLRGGSIIFDHGSPGKRTSSRRSFNGFNSSLDSSGRSRPEIPKRRPGEPKIPTRRPPVDSSATRCSSVERAGESEDYSDQVNPMSLPMDPSLSTAEEGIPPPPLEGALDDLDYLDDLPERRTFNVKLPSTSQSDVPDDGRCSFDEDSVSEGIVKVSGDGYEILDPHSFKNRGEEYPVLGAEEKKTDEPGFDSSKYRWAKKERGIPVLPQELGFTYKTCQRESVLSMDDLSYRDQVFISGMVDEPPDE